MPRPSRDFWSYVAKRDLSQCWLWTGGTTGRYGAYRSGRAHRFAWEFHHKRKIPPGASVLHNYTCESGLCCNPAHLRLGTHRENMQDNRKSWYRGRGGPRGRTMYYNPVSVWDGSIA